MQTVLASNFDKHHLIPKASKPNTGDKVLNGYINSIANYVIISSDDNKNLIKDIPVEDYLSHIKDAVDGRFNEILEANLINPVIVNELITNKAKYDNLTRAELFKKLLEDRAEKLAELGNKFMKSL
ncbi:hypothetical protein FHQ18_09625 [Deferribacter autotrophicus]|uniref:Uncharacterized protein n=1 Tax=Deferribacter autotrophicus TaxID=500465 RepID=A0A5A8F0X0_9BACT|nr:hypothetical protein [Deferribacter autotrophicus]KAA0257299.1 hypothetical protein FHQ18_09625 [Deferribacter autotrophicus]